MAQQKSTATTPSLIQNDPEFRAQHSGFVLLQELLAHQYPQQEPQSLTTLIKHSLGGPDPLDYIYVYHGHCSVSGLHYWHYISFGFTELHTKETDDATVSGYGFELTFRLRADADQVSDNFNAPKWPATVMQNLARYVFRTGNTFAAGDTVPTPHAIHSSAPQFRSLLVRDDPVFEEQTFPNGKFKLLQIVMATDDEIEAASKWNGLGLVKLLAEGNPLCICDLTRVSILTTNPLAQQKVNEGIARDGSSRGALFLADGLTANRLGFTNDGTVVCLQMGLICWKAMLENLPGRILFKRSLQLMEREGHPCIIFRPASGASSRWTYHKSKKLLDIEMTEEAVAKCCTGIDAKNVQDQPFGIENLWIRIRPEH